MRRRFYKSAAAFENIRRQKTVLPFCRCSTEKYEVAGNLKIKRQNAVEKVNIYLENYIEKFFWPVLLYSCTRQFEALKILKKRPENVFSYSFETISYIYELRGGGSVLCF